jgi:ACS family hexuronate transporter-like MFS transporter
MVSIPSLFRVFTSIPSGYLADRFNSKNIILLSFVIQIVSASIVSWSTNPWILVLSIGIMALAPTMYHPASLSYTTKLASESDRAKALGMQSAGGPLGMALGPLSLSLLLSYGWRFTYIFWIIPIFVLLPFIWRLKPDKEVLQNIEDKKETKNEIVNVEPYKKSFTSFISIGLVIFLIYSSVRHMGGRFIGSLMSLYLTNIRQLSVSNASLILGSVSLVGVVAAPLGGFLSDKHGYKRWLLMVISASITCITLAFISPNSILFVVLYFIYSFFNSCAMPANSSIVSSLTPISQRGIGFALSFLPGSIVGSIIPTIAGLLADQMGLSFLFPLGISIIIISLIVLKFGVKVG